MTRGLLAAVASEAASPAGLVVVVAVSVLLAAGLYPSYTGVLGRAGAVLYRGEPPPGAEHSVYMQALLRAVDEYHEAFMEALGQAMLLAAPLAAGLSIAYPIELGEDRFSLLYVARGRASLYAARSAAAVFWLAAPTLAVYLAAPLSLSATGGEAMLGPGGLLSRSVEPVAYAAFHASLAVLSGVAAGRAGPAVVAALLLALAARLAGPPPGALPPLTLAALAGGYLAYSRRDL